MNSRYIVDYKNVRLRPLQVEDLTILKELRNDEKVSKYLTPIGLINDEQQLNWYNSVLSDSRQMIFAIDETNLFNRCVGSCSIYNILDNEAYFGKIMIDPKYNGNKIGYYATKLSSLIAFEKLDINRLYSTIFEENIACQKMHLQAGYEVIKKYSINDRKEIKLMMSKDKFIFTDSDINIITL